jgi:hypothetical protein
MRHALTVGRLDRRGDHAVVGHGRELDRRVQPGRPVVASRRVEDRDVADADLFLERSARPEPNERRRADPRELLERDRRGRRPIPVEVHEIGAPRYVPV